jgi:demethylmenaquinone methyltransferase/2-methoxy-6-polyprenyl-1,4-benzoquinol methylase
VKLDLSPAQGALEPPDEVQRMFGRVAARYDVANAVLSGGLDFFWRRRAAGIVRGWQPGRLLDLATGSGVLAASLARACPLMTVVGADFSLPMLRRAQSSARVQRLTVADAMRLPFGDGVFDAVTVGFGLRNMPSYRGALEEMRRVLRPGGHRVYLHRCLPRVAALVSGERGAYEYLAESIERFPRGETMRSLLAESGFESTTAQELTGGIVSLYTGTTPRSEPEPTPSSRGNYSSLRSSASQ